MGDFQPHFRISITTCASRSSFCCAGKKYKAQGSLYVIILSELLIRTLHDKDLVPYMLESLYVFIIRFKVAKSLQQAGAEKREPETSAVINVPIYQSEGG